MDDHLCFSAKAYIKAYTDANLSLEPGQYLHDIIRRGELSVTAKVCLTVRPQGIDPPATA